MTTNDRVEGWWWLVLGLIGTIWWVSIIIRAIYWAMG